MTHHCVSEWGKVGVGDGAGAFTRAQADALMAAARAHPLGGEEGSTILADHHRHLRARQMVGVLSAPGCSLEILPKVDPDASAEDTVTVRRRLVRMLDLAHGLNIGEGAIAGMARQNESLLEILIRLFADRLLAETRRGLPRAYLAFEEDLSALRGRLDVTRQFTANAVRPDRLACRFDALSHDIPLLQVMKACVVSLRKHARIIETQRRLDELRFVFADIADVARSALPWNRIRLDRTNRRWETLLTLAKLFLRREWQATHRDPARDGGLSLLFPMNDLFEAYVAALLKRALANHALTVDVQGGRQFCLSAEDKPARGHFQTRPDVIIRDAAGKTVMVIDTKWKRLNRQLDDAKNGVSQADVYQLMAYGQLYASLPKESPPPRVMLLYPHHAGLGAEPFSRSFLIRPHNQQSLRMASVDVALEQPAIMARLRDLCLSPNKRPELT